MSDDVSAEAPTETPLVSVGMFVHNEAEYVAESIESILAQDYDNIEFIIADNASTDGTSDLCQALATKNPEISYVRHADNIGAAANSVFVLEQSRGRYFMWASGHDLWDAQFVSRCVEEMESNPESALAYSPSRWIDQHGLHWERQSGYYDTRGLPTIGRFFTAFWGNLHPVLGVIRSDILKSIPKIFACVGSDQIVLAELALRGDFLFVSGTSWTRRQPRKEETHSEKVERYRSKEFGLASHWVDRALPLARLPIELYRAVWRSNIGVAEKALASLALPPMFLLRWLTGRRK